MEYVFALPLVLSLISLYLFGERETFWRFNLPLVLLLPDYYRFQIPHAPPIAASAAALLPVAISVAARSLSSWRFSRMDLWMLLFLISQCVSEGLTSGIEAVYYDFVIVFCGEIAIYVIGKQLIEQQQLRVRTTQVMLACMAAVFVEVVIEFFSRVNLYLYLYSKLGLGWAGWIVQIRGGHPRVAGPYGGSILAGIIFFSVLILSLWLRYIERDLPRKGWRKLNFYYVPQIGLILCLLLTQSRGPILGAIVGITIAQIPRFKNILLAGVVAALLLGSGATAGYFIQQSASSSDTTEEAQTAAYRMALIDNYKPIAEEGGWFGWGQTHWPKVDGQTSIDNEYLLLWVTRGRAGLLLFCIIAIEAAVSLARFAIQCTRKDDMIFAFSLLGVFAGILVSIATVFLGSQTSSLFFLFVGWSQSLQLTKSRSTKSPAPLMQQRSPLPRVFF